MDRHYSKPHQKATEGPAPAPVRGSAGSFFRALKTTSKVLAISIPLILSKPVFSQTKVAANVPEGKKTEMVKEKKDTKAPAIFGQGKYFDSMEFDEKTGMLHIWGFTLGGEKGNAKLNVRQLAADMTEEAKKYGRTFSCEGLPLGLVGARVTGVDGHYGVAIYLIYEDAIFLAIQRSPNSKPEETVIWVDDNTKIFTHEGAIYTDGKGNLLATTPTTLLGFTEKWRGGFKYAGDIFDAEKLPLLQHPTFQLNVLSGKVDLRDPVFQEPSKTVKITINLTKFEIHSEQDDLVIGAR